jgi:hypothetical protein
MIGKDSNNNPMCDTIIPNTQIEEQPFILNRYVRACKNNEHIPFWINVNDINDIVITVQKECSAFTKFKSY